VVLLLLVAQFWVLVSWCHKLELGWMFKLGPALHLRNVTRMRNPKHRNILFFYIHSSVHRNSRLKKSSEMQQYADIYLPLNYSTCFGRPSRPSSGVHKTEVAASGTDYTIWGASFFKRDQIRTYSVTFEEACSPDSMICTRGCNFSFMHS